MDKDEITVYLENETTQKFNSWLEDCFQKLDSFYSQQSRKSGVLYKFASPIPDGKDTRSYILAAYNIGHRIERGINLKWVEVGARLKVMITFPSDSKIIHPVLDILIDLHNDFPETRIVVLDILRELKNKYQIEDSIIPLLTPQTTGDAEKIKDSRQRGKSGRPSLPEDVWAWEQVNKHSRPMNKVYKEWISRDDVQARNLQDPKRQFNRITKPAWRNKSGQNI